MMFCYQCEQTQHGTGCQLERGVCGKDEDTAALQDLLIHAAKGIAMYAHRAGELGVRDRDVDVFTVEALFTTVTNVNFDPERVAELLHKAAMIRDKAKQNYLDACQKSGKEPETFNGPSTWTPAPDLKGLIDQGHGVTILNRMKALGEDVVSLQELLTYGLKGAAAYADHAQILGQEDNVIYAYFQEALNFLTRNDATVDELIAMNMRCGEICVRVLELLDSANTG
ncbi:MAG: hydroxylamine reductase, partial [Candidatus Hinthialibacter sp.]